MTDPVPPTPASRRRFGILAMLMLLCFLGHFNRASITSAGDERIIQQFGFTPEKMGAVYSSFLLAYTLFMVAGGWCVDRWGPRVALTFMVGASAIFCAITGSIGFGFIPADWVWLSLLLVRSTMGVMNTPMHPAAARAVGGWFTPDQQPLANGLVTGASILAYAAVHPVFGGLIDRFDWPPAFVIAGVVTAAAGLVWWLIARDLPVQTPDPVRPRPGDETGVDDAVPPLSLDRRLVWLTLSYAAVGYFQYLFFYWLHYYFDTVLHMDKLESRFYAGLPNLAMAAAMPFGGLVTGLLEKRLGVAAGRSLLPKLAMALSAILLVVGVLARDRAWIIACFTASLGILGLCESAFWTTAVHLGGARGGTAAAVMNTGGNGIGLLAPIMTPWISERFGWGAAIAVAAVVGLLGAACWFGVRTAPKVITQRLDNTPHTS